MDHTADVFYTDGADDIFRLLVSRGYKECNLLVEIRGGGVDQDMGYWLDVGRAAAAMDGQCADSIGPYGSYGSGWPKDHTISTLLDRLRSLVDC